MDAAARSFHTYLSGASKLGDKAAFAKYLGLVFSAGAALQAMLETFVWMHDNARGFNTIMTPVYLTLSQASYLSKNIAGLRKTNTEMAELYAVVQQREAAYGAALDTLVQGNQTTLFAAMEAYSKGSQAYERLVACRKRQKAFAVDIVANIAGLAAALASVIAFGTQHKGFHTSFGPDWTTFIGALTLGLPLLQRVAAPGIASFVPGNFDRDYPSAFRASAAALLESGQLADHILYHKQNRDGDARADALLADDQESDSDMPELVRIVIHRGDEMRADESGSMSQDSALSSTTDGSSSEDERDLGKPNPLMSEPKYAEDDNSE